MPIRLIAIDLDGTLLNEHHTLNPATVETIKEAKKQGITVVLCSGRPLTGLQTFLHELGLTEPGDYAISYNGGMVQHADTGEALVQHGLTYHDFRRLFNLADDLGVHVQALDRNHLYTPNADISRYTVRESFLVNMPLFYRQATDFAPDSEFVKVMMIDEPDLLEQAKANIPADVRDDYYIVNSEPFFLEFMNKHVSKGNAVTALAEHLGYSMAEVMAIGDQANDLPMLKVAGTGVAMGNATAEVKAVADVETATNIEDGVAKAIAKYALK